MLSYVDDWLFFLIDDWSLQHLWVFLLELLSPGLFDEHGLVLHGSWVLARLFLLDGHDLGPALLLGDTFVDAMPDLDCLVELSRYGQ